MKIVSVVGARPQFVKLAPVSRALRTAGHKEVIVHTGQHYDDAMSAIFFAELEIAPPDENLGIGSGPHGMQTGRMLEAVESVFMRERPDLVLVFGDTNSTLAGALAAAKLHMPVAHIEAGLRSFDRTLPEEVNRVLTDHLSDLLYCPTGTARAHLEREGIVAGVEVVGDVMLDSLLQAKPHLASRAAKLLPKVDVSPHEYVLATVHRPANTDDPAVMRRIADALSALDLPVVFPVHPRTRHAIIEHRINWGDSVRLIEPVGYFDMLALEQSAHTIVTDSGGVQKEAFLMGVPCVTMRDRTEWPETVAAGWNTLAGTDEEAIIAAVGQPCPAQPDGNPFGDGSAAEQIVRSLDKWSSRVYGEGLSEV
jgi:UDP-GlcNAc3NAcA epimerase